ncbi:MAG TPA: Rieske 2Fe-2S domain-containing protein, partial [Anaerolineae bacterium]
MADITIDTPATSMSRREFLYYIWGASIALFLAQSAGLLVWFLIPRFREGEFGGAFFLPVEVLPEINGAPVNFPDGRFWLVNLDTTSAQGQERMVLAPDETEPIAGVAAIYKVCTHLGCIYAWTSANERFECPCHGSKYRLDGRRIEAPAPRSLDRFEITALDAGGSELATSPVSPEDDYVVLPLPAGTASLRIDTGTRK